MFSDRLGETYRKDLFTNHESPSLPVSLLSLLPDSADGRIVLRSAARLMCSVHDRIILSEGKETPVQYICSGTRFIPKDTPGHERTLHLLDPACKCFYDVILWGWDPGPIQIIPLLRLASRHATLSR